jgi:hypothetical protein
VLAVSLALFAGGAGPVWRHPWSIDRSIFISYLAIPPLVLAVLLATRRFAWREFLLDTLTVTAAKFGITYVTAAVLWAVSGEPPPVQRAPPPRYPPAPSASPPAVSPSEAAALEGVVVAAGAPRAGALVFVVRGAEGHAYPTRSDVVEVVDDGRGFVPPVAAVQMGEPLRLASGDGLLHAVRGENADGRTVFNAAVTVVSTVVRLQEPAGVLTLSCAVHEHAGRERPGRLVVLAHPFFATTAADGRFQFTGLPPGRLVVRALDAELGDAEEAAEAPSRSPVVLTLGVTRGSAAGDEPPPYPASPPAQ